MFKGRNANNVPRTFHVSRIIDRLSVFREKNPVENFYIQTHKSRFGSHDSVSIVDDVYMLFNQQRLDRMTNAALSTWLQNTSRTDSQLANLTSRMTTEQLGSFIKSRYIQSRSELLAWSSYLESQYPELIPSDAPVGDLPPSAPPSDASQSVDN